MDIAKLDKSSLLSVLEIYKTARELMRNTGNPDQWKSTYPEREIVEADIEKGELFGVFSDGELCAVFAFLHGEDSVYDRICEGNWTGSAQYRAIHRVASNGRVKGVLGIILEYCKGFGTDLKIDTHRDNKIMQHLLSKYGFVKCGKIYLENGEERLAYQWVNTN